VFVVLKDSGVLPIVYEMRCRWSQDSKSR